MQAVEKAFVALHRVDGRRGDEADGENYGGLAMAADAMSGLAPPDASVDELRLRLPTSSANNIPRLTKPHTPTPARRGSDKILRRRLAA
jgi:hypothetical protein